MLFIPHFVCLEKKEINQTLKIDSHGSDESVLNNYFIDTTEIKSITIIPGISFTNATEWTSNDVKVITINIR